MAQGQHYKIRLASGRVLGPIDIAQARKLIEKNRITGREQARLYPTGAWQDINQIQELSELLMAQLEGKLKVDPGAPSSEAQNSFHGDPNSPTVVLGPTVKLPDFLADPPTAHLTQIAATQAEIPTAMPSMATTRAVPEPPTVTVMGQEIKSPYPPQFNEDDDKTKVGSFDEDTSERTQIGSLSNEVGAESSIHRVDRTRILQTHENPGDAYNLAPENSFGGSGAIPVPHGGRTFQVPNLLQKPNRNVAEEKTIFFQRNNAAPGAGPIRGRKESKEWIKIALAAIAVGTIGYQVILSDPPKKAALTQAHIVRAQMPLAANHKDPAKSVALYNEAMKFYIMDNVKGYSRASELLLQAASLDMDNVKALAMLASCYLNLIDSSNKDENYFSVITKIIELSRGKQLDLAETVIADVELYNTINRPEAAQERIVEYTKSHRNFESAMFYYIAQTFYARGDLRKAAQYLAQYPDNKAFSPKVFYLRGEIAEKLNDDESAYREYEKALKITKFHALSRLKMVEILNHHGQLKNKGSQMLETLVQQADLLAPRDLARTYYLFAQLHEINLKYNEALGYIERAVKLDPENHDYTLEMFTLRARLGERNNKAVDQARMFEYLTQGEKLLELGQYQDALAKFLQARETKLDSPYPLVRIGDMFVRLNDMSNARMNYKLATTKAPREAAEQTKQIPPIFISAWTKYINTLIQSFDWEEAKNAMAQFRKIPVSHSAADKASGDIYARQGMYQAAQTYYRKAMTYESIDSEVYIAYAHSLYATKNYRDAPFFYALARRFDPMNIDAIVGTAKCIAASDSIDRGIAFLEAELQKAGGARVELLSAIAELQIQKGEWALAQQVIEQAMAVNPEYAPPWKLQAQIYVNSDGIDKKALNKALDAYKSFSDRNRSDPSGYLERYKIFIKKGKFEEASNELQKIFNIYPKYPNLHYYKGVLYSTMGNHKAGVEEFTQELSNNPRAISTLIALGKELIEVGAFKSAQEQFQKAMLIAPELPEPKHLCGWANYLLKNYTGALALLNAALSYDKGNPLIYKRLGIVYQAMGDAIQAGNNFRKYLEMEPDAPDKSEFARYL